MSPESGVAVAIGCLFALVDPLWTGWGMNGTWIVVSIMVVMEPSVGAGLRKAWLRVVGTLVGGLAGLATLYLGFAAAGGREWQGPATSVTQGQGAPRRVCEMGATITCLQALAGALLLVWKTQHPSRSYAYLVAVFTMPIIWIPGLRAPEGEEVWPAIRRMISILIGFGIAAVVQLSVFPVFARRQLTDRLACALEASVCTLYEAAAGAVHQQPGHTAKLQRAQLKAAAGLDALVKPTAVELKLIPGPLSAAAFASLVDSVTTVGSTAVHLSAVLEAAHSNAGLDDAAAALGAAFAALAGRIRDTLEGCCLQRHRYENRLCPACVRGARAQPPPPPPGGKGRPAAALTSAEALQSAAAGCWQLADGHEAARLKLAPEESDLSVVAMGAALVLLHQAQAVAAVLQEAGLSEAAAAVENDEEVRRTGGGTAGSNGDGGKQDVEAV
ncbi:hypothetical protein ABPG75_009299 [Micractinium tetrahymenae]